MRCPSIRRSRPATFPNGLRYLIRVNTKPEKRAELRLVVNAGSILEDDDQLGLAHFVEHMAFNGTKHFAEAGDRVVHRVDRDAVRPGAERVHELRRDGLHAAGARPTSRSILEKSFLILEDWAHNLSFDPKEIDKERGVIIEEWRLRRGAAARMQDQQLPILLHGSRYAERLPIGTTTVHRDLHARPPEAVLRATGTART